MQMLDRVQGRRHFGRDAFARFDLADVLHWVKTDPAFGAQAVYLEDRYERGLDPSKPETWKPSMTELKAAGVKILAPPIWVMLKLDEKK